MADATQAGSTTAWAVGLALAVLCARQFVTAYNTVGTHGAISTEDSTGNAMWSPRNSRRAVLSVGDLDG